MRSKLHGINQEGLADRPSALSANLFRTMFEEAPYGIALGGADHRLQNANRAFCEMLGYCEDELIGKTFYDFTYADDVAKTEVYKENIHHQRTPIQYVKRLVHKDGSLVLAKITNSALYSKTGVLLYSFGIVENITRQSELENQRAQLAAIVEFSSDAICSLSLNGIIQTWNQGAEKIYGYPAIRAVGNPATFLMSNSDMRGCSFSDAIAAAKSGISTQNLETIHKNSEGREFPVSLTISPIKNQFHQAVGVSMIARDMTAYKRALSALHQSEQRMREASEDLARTNRELEQFAFVASHDLQEPLRTISCFLQLLEKKHKGSISTEADEYIDFAVQGAKRMQRLILDLLQFSRVTLAMHDLKPTDLSLIIEKAKFNLRGLIDANEVTIHCSELPVVMSYQQQLVQVFQNLFSNAIKFRSTKKPVIRVNAEKVNGEWLLSVRDNGIGFSPEHAERIFLIFQRLHTRETYPGTGVGLAICKKVIESHGGRIWTSSSMGNGSTFYFTLQEPEAAALAGEG